MKILIFIVVLMIYIFRAVGDSKSDKRKKACSAPQPEPSADNATADFGVGPDGEFVIDPITHAPSASATTADSVPAPMPPFEQPKPRATRQTPPAEAQAVMPTAHKPAPATSYDQLPEEGGRVTKDQPIFNFPQEEETATDFDLRQAVIYEALLNRPASAA